MGNRSFGEYLFCLFCFVLLGVAGHMKQYFSDSDHMGVAACGGRQHWRPSRGREPIQDNSVSLQCLNWHPSFLPSIHPPTHPESPLRVPFTGAIVSETMNRTERELTNAIKKTKKRLV